MERQSFSRRVIFPLSVVLTVLVASSLLYDATGHIAGRALKAAVLYPSAVLMLLSLWLGPLFSNTVAFARGASTAERFLVSLSVPLLWTAKTYLSFIGIYSPGELVYLFFHPFIFGNLGVNVLCMGISELISWRRLRRRMPEASPRALKPLTVALLAAGFAVTALGLWNGGHSYYYHYMDIYTALFIN
ncbi:MAG: hypothetical protein JXA20_01805 [Spirochaetes bacterium]|nr:hypothetical protein [Spirochaetota bacterium]